MQNAEVVGRSMFSLFLKCLCLSEGRENTFIVAQIISKDHIGKEIIACKNQRSLISIARSLF